MRVNRFGQGVGIFLFGGLFFVLGCSNNPPAAGANGDKEAKKPAEDFEKTLKEIAQQYKSWTRVSDQANWAPTDCMEQAPAGVQVSASKDTGTHGRKLYFLFAKDGHAYEQISFPELWMADEKSRDNLFRSPVGQALVKESWQPIEVDPASVPRQPAPPGEHRFGSSIPDEYKLLADGKAYRTGEKAALFVMFKRDPQTPGTDEGWIYGTISPDGSQVYEAGRIGSCMNCHVKTDRDRLFGLPRGWKN